MPEVEIVDGGDQLLDEAVIRGIRRAIEKRAADDRALMPETDAAGDDDVKVTGKLRRVKAGVARHYGPGDHPGTGTGQEAHAGAGAGGEGSDRKTRVGITSARPGRPSEQVYADMRDFEGRLRQIESVAGVSVKPGVGGWEGGEEPTWVVEYEGNGEALRLLAETGKQFNQDAVLIMTPPGDEGGQPVIDWHFGEAISEGERDAIQDLLVDSGIGGWTWYRDTGGQSVLRAVAVPQWGGSAGAHLKAADLVSDLFSQAGLTYSRSDGSVGIEVMEREGEFSYDRVLEAAE